MSLQRCPGEAAPGAESLTPRGGAGDGRAGWSTSPGEVLGGREGGVCTGLPTPFGVHTSLPRPFRPRPPQQPTTEGGDGKTKPSQGPSDGSRPEPQRPRNRPYFQRRRQQPPGPRQPTAQEVRTSVGLSIYCGANFPLSFLPSFPSPPPFCFPLPMLLYPSVPPSPGPAPTPPPFMQPDTRASTAGCTSGRHPHPPGSPSRGILSRVGPCRLPSKLCLSHSTSCGCEPGEEWEGGMGMGREEVGEG